MGLCCATAEAQNAGQRIPRQTFPTTGAIEGILQNDQQLGLGNVEITIRSLETNPPLTGHTSGDGIFRFLNVPPGRYTVHAVLDGFQTYDSDPLVVRAGELVSLTGTMLPTGAPETRGTKPIPEVDTGPAYRQLPAEQPDTPDDLARQSMPPPAEAVTRATNRWKFDWPDYRRYGPLDGAVPNIPTKQEAMYVPGHLYDPFNRNKLKGDYPIFGQTFLNINLTSDTFNDPRQLPLPSTFDTARPNSAGFFGRFGQYALVQDFAFSATLFHGDTSFKPVDWQIKFTPELNVNYVYVQENGILNINPLKGNTRLDEHVGLQEAFVEKKIADLSDNYDFISIRAGIQTFNSDFRGFIFFDQEPGARLFGNLGSNRFQYNAAYFAMLEKDTNSGLNTFDYRHQQVFIANLFKQDFFKPGYTIQTSYHFNKDDPSVAYDTDGFLVRPLPVGAVVSNGAIRTDALRVHYIGVTGDGHFGRINVNHAFYEALGHDYFNPIANSTFPLLDHRRDVNAQMAALELSIDKDWIRYRVSSFFSSGVKNPNSTTERGFDSIMDNPNFAGGFFSFWIREGIRLLSTGVGLTEGNSLIPSLQSSKTEGQSNFVNPGIFIYNAASDFKIMPKLRAVLNLNLIRFDHTETLEFLLQQSGIHAGVGADNGLGVVYRPFLSDNFAVNGVVNAFVPFQGFKDIFNSSTLYSVAVNVRFRF
jgi:Carboxypeptidase regulatory-like domain